MSEDGTKRVTLSNGVATIATRQGENTEFEDWRRHVHVARQWRARSCVHVQEEGGRWSTPLYPTLSKHIHELGLRRISDTF